MSKSCSMMQKHLRLGFMCMLCVCVCMISTLIIFCILRSRSGSIQFIHSVALVCDLVYRDVFSLGDNLPPASPDAAVDVEYSDMGRGGVVLTSRSVSSLTSSASASI